MDKRLDVAKLVLRIGISIIFLYFGLDKLINPNSNIEIINSLSFVIFKGSTFVFILGIIEILIALTLLFGLFTRVSSIIASLMIITIFTNYLISFGNFLVRDLGLIAITIFLAITNGGKFSLDYKLRKNGRKN